MNVFCVNKSHKDFKKLSKELDIHEDQLDDIIYKYENDNQVDTFPSKEYIENLLRGDNPVTSLDQYGIWLNKYSEPKVFDSKEEANSYIEEAKRFFPVKEAIVTKRKVNGLIEVTVGRPYDKNDITSLLMHHLNTYEGIEVGNSTELGNYLQENGYTNILEAIEAEKEMLEIKAKAIADGTFMKAPNGKKSNLNERLWLQVRTKNFIKWFGDWINDPANASKVVDENGEPLVVYHGSKVTDIRIFKKDDHNSGYYFTSDINYAKNKFGNEIYQIFLNIKNPLDLRLTYNKDEGGAAYYKGRKLNLHELAEMELNHKNVDSGAPYYIREGYDGIFGNDSVDTAVNGEEQIASEGTEYVVWNPNQIKSATANSGEFSPFNDDIQMFIGKKARTKFEQSLKKARPDMSDTEIKATLDFLDSLEDNKENTAYIKTAVRWIANRSITLPQDNTKARQAFDLARKKHIDIQKYNTLGELITSDEMKPKEKEKKSFNPDKAKTFSNKRIVTIEGGRVFTVYDVENTEEGQREVCKALAAHYKMSPWCLSTFTATGEPTKSAKYYWNKYSSIPRKIAYENGKPVAFNSSDSDISLPTLETLIAQNNKDKEIIANDTKELNSINATISDVKKNWVNGVSGKIWNGVYLKVNFDKYIIPEDLSEADIDKLVKDGILKEYVEPIVNEVNGYEFTEKAISQIKKDFAKDIEEGNKDYLKHLEHIISDIEEGIKELKNNIKDREYKISHPEKINEKEAWWDMEDIHPQNSLSDSIVSDPQAIGRGNQEALEQLATQEAIEMERAYAEAQAAWTEEDTLELFRNMPFFLTPQGEIYGFVGKDNKIYLDERIISPEHPIHEYTHLWDRVVAKINPKLWKRGIELMKKTSLWELYANDPNYGLKWKATEGMTAERFEELVASEVHARLVGKEGEALLTQLAKEKGSKNIIEKLKSWLLDVWRELKSTFSNWSQEDINKLTLEDFNNMTLRDFVNKVSLDTNSLLRSLNEEYYLEQLQNSIPSSYEGSITPDANTIFVFGSNPKGIHGAGAAYTAKTQFGAIQGQGEGMQGNAYALPTKDLDKAKGTRWYRPGKKEETEVKEWYKNHNYSEVQNHPLNTERTITHQQIIESIKKLYEVANQNPDKQFKVSHYPFGQLSLNGYLGEEMLVMFKQAGSIPSNIVFSKEWTDHWNEVRILLLVKPIQTLQEQNVQAIETLKTAEEQVKQKQNETASNQTLSKEALKHINRCLVYKKQVEELSQSFKKSEIQTLSTSIANRVSSIISELEENPNLIKDYFNLERSELSEIPTREEIINKIGIDNLYRAIANKYFGNVQGFLKKGKAIKIQRNFQILMLLSNPILSKNEGIQVDFNFTKKDVEEILDSFNENDEANENSATSQESWQNNIRTVSVENMMLPKIRRLLSNLPLIKNGELIKDEWGIPQTVSLREAIGTILNAIGGKAKDHKQMASLLTLYIEDSKNTWLQPIVDILNDTTGKYETELSLLFKDFCKNSLKFSVSGKDFISHIIDSKLDYAFSRVKQTFGSKLWLILNKTDDKVNKEGLNKLVELATVDKLKTKEGIKQLYEAFGIYLSNLEAERIVSLGREESLVTTIRSIYAVLKEVNEEFTPFDRNSDSGISSYLHTLLEPYVKITSEGFTSTVVSEGKRYQLFVLPSFLSKFNSIILNSSEEDLVNWMMNTYGNVEWYKLSNTNGEDVLDSVADGWRNPILLLLATDPNFRKNFDWTQSLGYREEKLYQFMRTMSPLQCFKMQLNMFNATDGRKGDIIPAWYAVPLMANKPSAEFIKLNRYRGDNYKAIILGLLAPMFIKEVYRIKLVRDRKNYIKEHPEKEIQNFDKRGDKFCNFEMFNDVSESSKKTIEDFIEDKASVEELSNMFNSEMTKYLDSRVVTNSMLLGVQDTALENFYWNNFLAKMSMEDLFLGDSAFYKNVVDKVKRALLLHSSGQRPNTSATWNKKLVSDGKHRAIVLSSFKEIKSNIISNLKEVFAKRAALFTGEDRNAFEAYADSIIKLYEEVDVTDGQAYTTISGYRKKAIMFGKWSREAEEVYNRLKNGEVNLSVLKQAFPSLKPFQYSQTKTDLSNNEITSNVSSTLVPSQYKTAEYLLIMADALLLGSTKNNNILKAITDIIEDTHNGEGDDYKKGIDTVLFDSSVKEGNSAVIDISTLIKEGKTAGDIKTEINNKISGYKQNDNNPYVKVTPFEDYMILQELPPHFKDHYQSFPTLARYLAITDLLSNFNGEEVLFTIGDKSYTVKELLQEWEKTWKEEVDYGTDKLLKELAITSGNKTERNVRLSKLLVNSLLDSSKMNMETFESILVDENGEFQMPIDDPALATTVMPLIFSAVKSRVNKQTAAGGPIVQVSSFGTSKKLNIRFKDKSGKLLPTREGWENSKNKSHESYDDFIKENQAGVAYMEVYASVPSDEIFNTFRDKKGNIDINAINRVNPGLLEMIGVRIPTEGKLSMWPMKIVGFLPYEAGEAIMLPEEITKITGSDFDSDKQYVIRKALSIVERTADNKKEKVINYLLEQNKNYTREFVEKAYDEYMENPENYKDSEDVHWEVENALSKSHIKYAARAIGDHNKRRNRIFDMMMAVLQHESIADQLLTPQGFEQLKGLAAEINGVSDFSELQNDPTNLTDLATYLNYYNLNKEGGQMLGIFASQKLAHAVLSMDNYHLLISGLEKTPFKLGGQVYKGLIAIDPLYNKEGTLIGEILGSCVGASADVTKDPVLPYLGINSYNINVFITGVRLGIPLKPLVLLLNHPVLKSLYAKKNNGETKSLKSLVSKELNKQLEIAGFEEEGRNSEMFMSKDALETDLTALNAFLTLIYCSETVDTLSKKTRLNSTTDSATVGPYFGDFLYKDKVLSNPVLEIYDEKGNLIDANSTFYENHPMLEALYNAFPIIKKIFKDTSLGNLLNTILEEGLRTTGVEILKNQGLATKFIKFYQSLLLFYLNQSDPNKGISIKKVADGYYDTFAKNFNKIKESYKDNQLIKTIKIEIDNKGEATLLIPNLDDLGREEVNALRAAWEDLAVDAPEVARDLFEWNAVKGGLTFNPNTFVHLAGNNVRSLIPGYKEAFTGNADFNISRIYDDFIVKYWGQLMLPRLTPKIIDEKSYKYVTDGEYLYKLNDSGEYREVNTNIPVYQQLSELMDESKSESQEGMLYQDEIYRLEDIEISDNSIALDALEKSNKTDTSDTSDYLKLNELAGLHIPLTKEEKDNIVEDLKGYCAVKKNHER